MPSRIFKRLQLIRLTMIKLYIGKVDNTDV